MAEEFGFKCNVGRGGEVPSDVNTRDPADVSVSVSVAPAAENVVEAHTRPDAKTAAASLAVPRAEEVRTDVSRSDAALETEQVASGRPSIPHVATADVASWTADRSAVSGLALPPATDITTAAAADAAARAAADEVSAVDADVTTEAPANVATATAV